MNYPFNNPYLAGPPAYAPQPYQPPTQVVRVKGRPGAETYSLGPNSSALLLDESGTIVWAVTTDGAGYKTISPYDITPHQDAPDLDLGSLENRIARLEGFMHELSGDTPAARTGEPAAAERQKSDGYASKR